MHVLLKYYLKNINKLLALADQLLEKEVIFKEDLEKIFGMSASDAVAKTKAPVIQDAEAIEEVVAEVTAEAKTKENSVEEAGE